MKRITAIMLTASLLTLTACGEKSVGQSNVNDSAELLFLNLPKETAEELNAPEPEEPTAKFYDPVGAVCALLENSAAEYEIIPTEVIYIYINEDESKRFIDRWADSEDAEKRGWDNDAIKYHSACVTALYHCEYDHTKTFMDDGYCKADYYLLRDDNTGFWEVVDNMTPSAYSSREELLSSAGLTEKDLPDYKPPYYRYARLVQTDIDDNTTAYIDVYYDRIIELDGIEYYSNAPFLVVQSKTDGRILATTVIPTPLVAERGAASPKKAYIKSFKLDRETVIAVQIPFGENDSHSEFFQYGGALYGLQLCNTSEGLGLSRAIGLDTDTLTAEGAMLADGEGRSYEFDFEQYPTYITISS